MSLSAFDEASAEAARRIVERELLDRGSADQVAMGIETTFARLQGLLGNLVGHAGFRALLARAEHLARSDCDFPEMSASHEAPPYALADLTLLVERRGVDGAAACAQALLAHLLRLMCSFIGAELTFRLVGKVWADIPNQNPRQGSQET